MENETPVLEMRHLVKTFPLNKKQRAERHVDTAKLFAVNDLSFTLYPGKIYGLLGPNGAGKTTTLRMIATLIAPTSGEILYRGSPIQKDPG